MTKTQLNRRDFVKKSAQAAAVLAAPEWFFISNSALEDKRLGVALLGLGSYSTHQLAPAFEFTRHCKLAGIVTGTPSKIPDWTAKYNLTDKNIYTYDDFDNIAKNKEIDIVYVVTPNALHLPFAERAAAAGKHVICEKPMEISSERAQKIVDACKKNGKKLQIGYRLQYDPYHLEINRLGRTAAHGKVKVVSTAMSFYGVNSPNWRFTDPQLSGGGPMMDIGIYCLQGIINAVGEMPMSVTAQQFKTIKDKLPGMEETILWQMEFPGGAIATCSSSYVARENFIRVSTENGFYGLDRAYDYGPLTGYINGVAMPTHTHRQQTAQLDAFALNILNDTPVVADGAMGVRDMRLIESIYEAAKKGIKINL